MPHSLARCLVSQPLRRLQHKHRRAFSCKRFRDRPRNRAAHFFIAVQQQRHRPHLAKLLQRSNRLECHHHPGLHIQNAGPVNFSAALAPRHLLERPERPHCIQVRQQHHVSAHANARPTKLNLQHITRCLLLMPLYLAAQRSRSPSGNQLSRAINSQPYLHWETPPPPAPAVAPADRPPAAPTNL